MLCWAADWEGAFLPTVYVTATAMREIKDNSLPLTIARGFEPLKVTKKSTRLPVTITAPETSRSQRVQQIQVQTAPDTEVTVAVVDEGILQIKRLPDPRPARLFLPEAGAGGEAYDLYPYLFPELGAALQHWRRWLRPGQTHESAHLEAGEAGVGVERH